MIIWSEFRMRQYRSDDHREDAPLFISIDILAQTEYLKSKRASLTFELTLKSIDSLLRISVK